MASFSIEFPRGDTVRLPVAVTRPAGGAVVDLSGCSLRFTVKRKRKDADADAIMVKTIGDGILISDAPAGLAVILIDPEDTDTFTKARTFQCDLQLVEPDDTITTVADGTLTVTLDVTRSVP